MRITDQEFKSGVLEDFGFINIDKGQLLDDAAKLVADAAHLTKNLRPGSHSDKKADENKCEETKEEQAKDDNSNFHFKHMNADSDIADLDIEDLSVDIDEDLSEGVSDLYANDGVSDDSLIVRHIEENTPENAIVFLTGIGKCYPLLRSHKVLNNLSQSFGRVPVVLFFPGTYDEQSLILFDELKDDNYYRAFRLVKP